ncbi:MAG: Rrf2 family transcriptional regulator [bacterium]|nr:Rrf2 family transcriptional regulator [bacterium]
MIITKQSDYGIRLMLALAEANEPLTTRKVAETHNIPMAFLHKVVSNLVRAKLLDTKRGVGGGMVISKQLEEISLYDIVLAIEGEMVINDCKLNGKPCRNIPHCAIHDVMDDITNEVIRRFSEISLAQLLEKQKRKPSYLRFHQHSIIPMVESRH